MLRIRNKAKVKRLNIPEDKLKAAQELTFMKILPSNMRTRIKKITGFSPCSVCQGIPSASIAYPVGGATLIEYYCELDFRQSYERIEEPTELVNKIK